MKSSCASLVSFLHRQQLYFELSIIICVSFYFCSDYTESRPFLPPTPPHQQGAGGAQEVQGTDPGQLTPADLRNIPDHTGLMLSIEGWGKGGKARYSVMAFFFSSYMLQSLWGWLSSPLPMGNEELIPWGFLAYICSFCFTYLSVPTYKFCHF